MNELVFSITQLYEVDAKQCLSCLHRVCVLNLCFLSQLDSSYAYVMGVKVFMETTYKPVL